MRDAIHQEGCIRSLKVPGRSGPLAGDARSPGRKASSCFSSRASLGLAGIGICSLFQICRGAGLSISPLKKSLFPLSFRDDPRAFLPVALDAPPDLRVQNRAILLTRSFSLDWGSPGILSQAGKLIPALGAAAAFPAATFLPLSALQRAWAGARLCQGRS